MSYVSIRCRTRYISSISTRRELSTFFAAALQIKFLLFWNGHSRSDWRIRLPTVLLYVHYIGILCEVFTVAYTTILDKLFTLMRSAFICHGQFGDRFKTQHTMPLRRVYNRWTLNFSPQNLPLSPSSIIWYSSVEMLCGWEDNRREMAYIAYISLTPELSSWSSQFINQSTRSHENNKSKQRKRKKRKKEGKTEQYIIHIHYSVHHNCGPNLYT